MYIGLDVGGTNLVAGLVDREGRSLHKAVCPVDRSWTAEGCPPAWPVWPGRRRRRADARSRSFRRRGRGCPAWWTTGRAWWSKRPICPFGTPAPGSVPAGAGTAPLSGQRR